MSDQPKFGKWQPIKTAPEWVPVLVYWPETRNNQAGTTVAWKRSGAWALAWVGDGALDDLLAGEPTRWMPLPQDPY